MFTDRNRAIRERQVSHDLYRSGIDHYNGEYDERAMFDFVNQMPHITQNTTSPFINVTDDAKQASYDAYMESNYNPFIGNEGAWVTPEGNDVRGSNNGTAKGYRDDSISAYLKHAFAAEDQVENRANAMQAFRKWQLEGVNPATTRMHQRHFDALGLADFGLEYEGKAPTNVEFVPQDISGGWNPGGMMTGGPRPEAVAPADIGGGNFMSAYKAKRDALASKPSVMSLMTELKDA